MRGFEEEYRGRVDFNIILVSAEGSAEAIAEHELGSHGLVAFKSSGEVAKTIPGHQFTQEDIRDAIDAVLR